MSEPAPRVIQITGLQRSGSTVLSRYLATVMPVLSVGEAELFWFDGLVKDWDCSCGKRFSDCDYWRRVHDLLLKDRDPRTFAVNTGHVSNLSVLVATLTGFGAARMRQISTNIASLYQAIAEIADHRVILDSSKSPGQGQLLRQGGIDLKQIHLVRDSRAVVYSWRRKKMRRKPWLLVTLHWIYINFLVFWYGRGRTVLRLRYEDFAMAPERALGQLTAFLADWDLKPGQGGEEHIFAGNPDRLTPLTGVRLDDEWRRELPRGIAWSVKILTWPLLKLFGYL